MYRPLVYWDCEWLANHFWFVKVIFKSNWQPWISHFELQHPHLNKDGISISCNHLAKVVYTLCWWLIDVKKRSDIQNSKHSPLDKFHLWLPPRKKQPSQWLHRSSCFFQKVHLDWNSRWVTPNYVHEKWVFHPSFHEKRGCLGYQGEIALHRLRLQTSNFCRENTFSTLFGWRFSWGTDFMQPTKIHVKRYYYFTCWYLPGDEIFSGEKAATTTTTRRRRRRTMIWLWRCLSSVLRLSQALHALVKLELDGVTQVSRKPLEVIGDFGSSRILWCFIWYQQCTYIKSMHDANYYSMISWPYGSPILKMIFSPTGGARSSVMRVMQVLKKVISQKFRKARYTLENQRLGTQRHEGLQDYPPWN